MGALIGSGYGNYVGTFTEVKTKFKLSHDQLDIFTKQFNSEDISVVQTGSDKSIFNFGEHFFVTGEELEYNYGNGERVGIATTVISGISTDKLPEKLFAIKIDSTKIKVASTAENALKFIPEFLEITNLGVGTQHYFKSKNQNTKSLITIDNVIQTPITSAGSTTILLETIDRSSFSFLVDDESIFSSGDILKINNEIMKVESIGVGGTSRLIVKREFLGTTLDSHSNGSLITKLVGNYNIVDNDIHFSSPPYGNYPQENQNYPNEIDYSGIITSSSFSGRIFLRSGIFNTPKETYFDNHIFDSISNQLIGITTNYELTVNGQDVTNISENNAITLIRNIFQTPQRNSLKPIVGNYYLEEENGKTLIYFTGEKSQVNYDINVSNLPLGGIIYSVGSTSGFGYQPLVSSAGTAVISPSGSIDSIVIGNSGSGYRLGIQTHVNVGIKSDNHQIKIVGIASISNGNIVDINITNPGVGYTSSNPPSVVIDAPVGYTNIPLVYSQYSQQGIGTGASVDLIVSQNSEIYSFEMKNNGYGYKKGDILTIGVGGTVGIPTNTSLDFNEFQIFVDETYQDDVSIWSFGELEVLDSFDEYFDSKRKKFFLRKDGLVRTIRSRKGSNIDVESTILVFINNILQVPGESYTFSGGSVITFAEPPKGEDPLSPGSGDKSKIIFYRGTPGIDVIDKDILETIEQGDLVNIDSTILSEDQNNRLVTNIISSDVISTNPYSGPGLSSDENLLRPIKWIKSKTDKFIDGKEVTKDRVYNEALINPVTNIIQSVGIGSTAEIFVENIKSFFDNEKEFAPLNIKSTIEIVDQNQIKTEIITEVQYKGDFGIITGIGTTVVGIGSTGITLTLSIPSNSVLNDVTIVDPIIPTSGIYTGAFFVIRNSNIGYGLTSLYNDGSILSIGSSFIDNVYQVYSTKLLIDNSVEVTTLVENYDEISIILNSLGSNYIGDYSWGRITSEKRKNPKEFEFYSNGVVGVNTSALVRRLYPLKYSNYKL